MPSGRATSRRNLIAVAAVSLAAIIAVADSAPPPGISESADEHRIRLESGQRLTQETVFSLPFIPVVTQPPPPPYYNPADPRYTSYGAYPTTAPRIPQEHYPPPYSPYWPTYPYYPHPYWNYPAYPHWTPQPQYSGPQSQPHDQITQPQRPEYVNPYPTWAPPEESIPAIYSQESRFHAVEPHAQGIESTRDVRPTIGTYTTVVPPAVDESSYAYTPERNLRDQQFMRRLSDSTSSVAGTASPEPRFQSTLVSVMEEVPTPTPSPLLSIVTSSHRDNRDHSYGSNLREAKASRMLTTIKPHGTHTTLTQTAGVGPITTAATPTTFADPTRNDSPRDATSTSKRQTGGRMRCIIYPSETGSRPGTGGRMRCTVYP